MKDDGLKSIFRKTPDMPAVMKIIVKRNIRTSRPRWRWELHIDGTRQCVDYESTADGAAHAAASYIFSNYVETT